MKLKKIVWPTDIASNSDSNIKEIAIKCISISFCVLLLSCSDKRTDYIEINLASSFSEKPTTLLLNNIAKDIRIIPIETTDSTLLRYLFFADVTQNEVIAYDKTTLFLLNKKTGSLNKIINNQGIGPKEYAFIIDAIVNNTYIHIFDSGKRGFLKYDYSGNYIDFYKNDSIGTFKSLADNNNYVACYSPYVKSDYFFSIYDKDWNYIREGVKNDRKDIQLAMDYLNIISNFNNELLFKDIFGDTIYRITPSKDIPYLVLNKGRFKMPVEIASSLETLYKNGNNYIQQENFVISSKYCFLSYYYDNKQYYDIWNIQTSRLLYRNVVGSNDDPIGIKITVDSKTINIWGSYAKDNFVYCVVDPENALKLIPSLPEDTNPIILEIELEE